MASLIKDKQLLDNFMRKLDNVRVATTVAGTLASDFENADVIDGVALVTADRILIKDQASGVENGIYIVEAAGAPTRAADMPTGFQASGVTVAVDEGDLNGGNYFLNCNDDGSDIVGTDALVWIGSSATTAVPTKSDKDVNPTATSGDEETTGILITTTPSADGYVTVRVNGVSYSLGDAVKTKAAYFSADGGTTARATEDIVATDELIWNGVVAGFDLETDDCVDLDYDV